MVPYEIFSEVSESRPASLISRVKASMIHQPYEISGSADQSIQHRLPGAISPLPGNIILKYFIDSLNISKYTR